MPQRLQSVAVFSHLRDVARVNAEAEIRHDAWIAPPADLCRVPASGVSALPGKAFGTIHLDLPGKVPLSCLLSHSSIFQFNEIPIAPTTIVIAMKKTKMRGPIFALLFLRPIRRTITMRGCFFDAMVV